MIQSTNKKVIHLLNEYYNTVYTNKFSDTFTVFPSVNFPVLIRSNYNGTYKNETTVVGCNFAILQIKNKFSNAIRVLYY